MSDDFSNASKRAKSAASDTARDIESRLESLRADMDDIVKALGDKAGKQVSDLRDKLSGPAVENLVDELQAALDELKRQASKAEKKVVETAREHPLQSILVAFGLGFLISLLMRR